MSPIDQSLHEMEKNEIKPCYKIFFTRDPGVPDVLVGPDTGLFHAQGR